MDGESRADWRSGNRSPAADRELEFAGGPEESWLEAETTEEAIVTVLVFGIP